MDNAFCLVVLVVFLIGFIALATHQMKSAEAAEKRQKDAYTSYQEALGQLKGDPTNADKKQYALQAGRFFAQVTREQKAVTVFDEVALSNDINAATAGATKAQPAPTVGSVEERLHALDALHAKGVLTAAEHAAKRQQLIDQM